MCEQAGCREVGSVLRGDVGLELGQRVARALRVALDVDITAEEALIRPSNRDGADYQCNVAMSLAKKIGKNPREVASLIVEHLDAWPEALKELGTLVATGQLKYRETVAHGLDAAPEAFLGLLKGKNFGKQVV